MKRILMTTAAAVALAGSAQAGGIDRSGQGLGALFETGRYVELSFGSVQPSIDGRDLLGNPTGSVGPDYTQLSLSYKQDINDKLSFALVLDQPFGANVKYDGSPATTLLGGTNADASATSLTGILRYKLGNGMSVHGGIRATKSEATVGLTGRAYGPLNGYKVDLASDTAAGYLVGAAFEKPEIALRVAVTYHSATTHKFSTVETGPVFDPDGPGPIPAGPYLNGSSVTEVDLPQSVNLDFQSGVAKDTLVFGQIRWADWSAFRLDPQRFKAVTGGGLIDLDDSITYSLGVGRKFNDNWAGALSVSYEDKGDPLVSPLAPTNGKFGVTLGATYTRDNMKISMGVNYTKVGDAQPETGTPDTARALMTNNDAIGFGMKIGFSF